MTRQPRANRSTAILTIREREVVTLIVAGLSNKELSQRLRVAEGTIKVHLHNIYEKLGIPNRTALCALTIPHRDWLLGSTEHARAKPN